MVDRIKKVKEIIAQDSDEEVWKLLHYFHHAPVCESRIREIHSLPPGQHKQNVAKQAQQIGYCLRQAEQYLRASRNVGLSTRPVLVYYGVTSLSQALVLLKGSGNQSFDKRRESKKHNHHGLTVGGISNSLAKSSVADFLKGVTCRVYTSPSGENGREVPWGQFPLFYESLIAPAFTFLSRHRIDGRDAVLNQPLAMACADISPIESWLNTSIPLIDLIANIPELYHILLDVGVGSNVVRGDVTETAITRFEEKSRSQFAKAAKPKKGSEEVVPITILIRDLFLNDLTPGGKAKFIQLFAEKNPSIKFVTEFGEGLHFRWTLDLRNAPKHSYFPDIVDSISNQKFFISKPSNYLVEPASYFAILFCLSMLARYHPDIWIQTLETNVQFSELMNSFLNVAVRKLPLLTLDQMTSVKHLIHS